MQVLKNQPELTVMHAHWHEQPQDPRHSTHVSSAFDMTSHMSHLPVDVKATRETEMM
jgi:hypothetical protein